MDKKAGFNLLQAAVLEEEYDIVLKAQGLPSYKSIKRLYNECAKDNSRQTKLQWATCNDDAEQAVELVLNDGVDINARASDNDYTVLMQASRSSSSQFIETLIDLGADVNMQRKKGKETPLKLAAVWNNYMAVFLLVRHGTDINVQDSYGFTPLHVSVRKGRENLIKLLLANKVDVNIQDEQGYTPLHLSVKERNENLCRLLLEHNADVNIQDRYGNTPLHWCAIKGNENLCRLLLEQNGDVNIQDRYGISPLNWCAVEGNENICRLLLEHNADVNIHDKDGYTPLDWCAREGKENLCRLLLEHNAMQQHPKFELSSGQKAIETKYTTGVASVQGAEKLKSNFKSEKTVRQNPSYTHTTLKTEELWETPLYTTKELEKEREAKQVKTLAVRHPKSKATTSSRTNKCVMA